MQSFLAWSPENYLPDCAIAIYPTGQLPVCKLPITILGPENCSDGVSELPEQEYNLLHSGKRGKEGEGNFKMLSNIFWTKQKIQYQFVYLV